MIQNCRPEQVFAAPAGNGTTQYSTLPELRKALVRPTATAGRCGGSCLEYTDTTTANAAWQIAADPAELVWSDAERDAAAIRSNAATLAQATYDQAERDATAVWKLAETTANTAYDTAILNADNAFAAEETAAKLDYDAAIAAADVSWDIAQANAEESVSYGCACGCRSRPVLAIDT